MYKLTKLITSSIECSSEVIISCQCKMDINEPRNAKLLYGYTTFLVAVFALNNFNLCVTDIDIFFTVVN